jgi:hypothetical protein
MVALGNSERTAYSPWNLVLRSIEADSGSAPQAEKWMRRLTPGFLAQARAILFAT